VPNPPVATRWKPGVSANPGGRPKKKLVDRCIEELLTANDSKEAMFLAKRVVKLARSGSMKAIQFLVERSEGKARQPIDVSGQDGSPLFESVEQREARIAELLSRRSQ
jgi:uncharacterized protein DUF5681